ncbi:hypothetical protein N8E89_20970 (plasmid) [Phyllobacterium sp. A18/5-2]|uniref:hypothetical protein n=1 Tax=Phyllobacterium sp. A18/5-2 TaxID=2978392 RepID=UPI0021C84E1A|nr:hypothetical protein [Phyllobacterium sp. A18/5-2]UXN67011.1 hypothetical protein N8E89_20970 [Phyllobacterium sp. A18/5-2]
MMHIKIHIVDGDEAAEITAQATGRQNDTRSLIIAGAGRGLPPPNAVLVNEAVMR